MGLNPAQRLEWRIFRFWTVQAQPDATLPRGWHWGEAWHEQGVTSRSRHKGRWAVRNRDGRQVRVAFDRLGYGTLTAKNLDTPMVLEDLARAAPEALARVMSEMEERMAAVFDDASPLWLNENYKDELASLNDLARRILDEV
jgi:hypothetical protein